MASLLSGQNLTKAFGPRPLFANVSLGIEDGDHVGFIGPNGAGKSTLLQILAGRETADTGTVSTQTGLRVEYVPQEETFAAGQSVTDILTAALQNLPLDESERERRIARTLQRINFPDGDALVDTLSGGWRKRLSIARAVIAEPELMLLDEPTNHLDLDGVLWLEQFLQSAPFAFLLISHDRTFLENVAKRMMELNPAYPGGLFSTAGNYSGFLERREAFMASQAKQEQALAGVVRREIEWLRRGAKARTTKAKGRIEQAGDLIGELAELKYRNQQVEKSVGEMEFSASGRQTKELVVLTNVEKALGGRQLFANLDLLVSPKQRLGIVGGNGSGKTTLLKLFAGQMEPDKGTVRRAGGLKTVWFEQDRGSLNPNETLRDALCPNGDNVSYRGGSIHVSSWAKRFLFRNDQLNQTVGTLSGGEQARVLIARLMLQSADLLILDEPTNDLDIATLEVLEESLMDFPGAVVLVTHDRYLLDRVSSHVLGLNGDGQVRHFADYEQWEEWRQSQENPALPSTAKKTGAVPAVATAAPTVATARLSASERKELSRMEDKINKAEETVAGWEAALSNPAVASDAAKLQEAWDKLAESKQAVSDLYDRWQELEARQLA